MSQFVCDFIIIVGVEIVKLQYYELLLIWNIMLGFKIFFLQEKYHDLWNILCNFYIWKFNLYVLLPYKLLPSSKSFNWMNNW